MPRTPLRARNRGNDRGAPLLWPQIGSLRSKSKGLNSAAGNLVCCLADHRRMGSGRSVAWLARLLGVQEVVSSNLTAPTILQLRLVLL